jgi:hypothetical protein
LTDLAPTNLVEFAVLEMSHTDQNPRRILTEGEAFVLQQIQDIYGYQNTEQDVFFSDRDEAVILVKDRNGVGTMMTVLTNLANWYSDGTIASVDELRRNWLMSDDA